MGVSRKLLTITCAGSLLLVAGCADSLWPSLEAPDPSGSSAQTAPASQPATTETMTAAAPAATQTAVAPEPVKTMPDSSYSGETFVGKKVDDMTKDLVKLQNNVERLRAKVEGMRASSQGDAANYHELVGRITTRLQRGSTPGNPILVAQWNEAQQALEKVAETLPSMTKLSNEAADEAAFGQYLLNAVQATYGLSGAVEEDFARLQVLEDKVHQSVVEVDRILNDLSQDINRQTTYVNLERQNMTTLSLAIKNGDLYGSSIATRAFTQTENMARAESRANMPRPGDRPLVTIRFDRPNVNYQQALYDAVSQALARKPAATFDLVAISPDKGNAAQVALNSAASRRNAEDVLRTLTDMGVPGSRVQLLSMTDPTVTDNEVRIYVH